MTHSMTPWKLMLVCVVAALFATTTHAQGKIQWRTDYNTARKEAEAKRLPLVIDFTTISCYHCERMDKSTFLDARIVSTSNEQFIPLKINHAFDGSLGTHLKINLFPTIVVASPEGRVIDKRIGYQSADQMHELLQTTLATLAPNEGLPTKYLAAVRQEAAGDYVHAVSNLRDLLDGGKPLPINKDARELLNKIEQLAADRLSQAKEMQTKGQHAEALRAYNDIVSAFTSLSAAREARDQIAVISQARPEVSRTVRNQKARELIDQATMFFNTEAYVPCLDRCKLILENFADLPEGQQAHLLASKIKNNRDWLRKATDTTADQLAELNLALADSHLKSNEVRQAQSRLQMVIAMFPGSRYAESAQIRLSQLEGTVPVQAIMPVSRPK